jgi:hypothetical protein
MKFKIGDKVRISLGMIGVISECRVGKKKNTYKIMINYGFILCNEEDLSLVPE